MLARMLKLNGAMRRSFSLVLMLCILCWMTSLITWWPTCTDKQVFDDVLTCDGRDDCIDRLNELKVKLESYDVIDGLAEGDNSQNALHIHRKGRQAKSANNNIGNTTRDDAIVNLKVIPRPFWPALDAKEKEVALDLLATVSDVCDKMNITYFIYGGTLLGSYRHHDVIPWDDDVDIVVPNSQRPKLFSALGHMKPTYDVSFAGARIKFYNRGSPKTLNKIYSWHFPYVDISFYEENATHMWDSDPDFQQQIFDKTKMFPLHKRPLADLWVRAPKDTYYYLKTTYRSPGCQTYHYSHKYEATKPRAWLRCEKLKQYYGFVHRTPHPDGVLETLKVGNLTKRAVIVKEPRDVIPKPYSLELNSMK